MGNSVPKPEVEAIKNDLETSLIPPDVAGDEEEENGSDESEDEFSDNDRRCFNAATERDCPTLPSAAEAAAAGDGVPLPTKFPLIRVISNLSTTSLKEVSTTRPRRSRRKPRVEPEVDDPFRSRRNRHCGVGVASTIDSTGGRPFSDATTTFRIYSDTSASTNGDHRAASVVSTDGSISASDSASNSALRISRYREEEEEPPGRVCGFHSSVFVTLAVVATFAIVSLTAAVTIFVLNK